MLLNEGKLGDQEIVKSETLEQMFKNQLGKIERSPGKQFKFGLGFRVFPQGDYGWGGAAGTRFWVHPKKEMAIIFMMQIMPNGNRKYGELVRDAAYAAMR
jgi:CubicO group peptidase (beta-lactamase class C family)